MVQKRETKAINKLCVREILSLSFLCRAYFFEFRGWNLVCFGIRIISMGESTGKFAREVGKARMRTAFFVRLSWGAGCVCGVSLRSGESGSDPFWE